MTPSSLARDHYPIIIIGGGLTGKMMALTLSHSGYDVALIAPQKDTNAPIDKRTTTIHSAGAKMLTALGLMPDLADQLVPIHSIAVAIGAQRPYHSDWLLNWTSHDEVMAYVVENHCLDSALDNALNRGPDTGLAARNDTTRHRGIIHQIDDSITAYHELSMRAQLETKTGRSVSAQLVVACDGTKSQMRSFISLSPKIEETGQAALIANLDCELPHNETAYQRFLPSGPIALMPLAGRAVSLVWSTSHAQAQTLLTQDEETVNEAINDAFGDELGQLRLQVPLSSFPLRPHYNRHMTKGRVILAGDAAHAIHPLAGMGYNLALADAAILLDLLNMTQEKGLAPDHASVMALYQKRRKAEVLALSTMTSQLNKLLSRTQSPLVAFVAGAMSVIDKTPLKRAFSEIAKGGKLSTAPLLKGRLK